MGLQQALDSRTTRLTPAHLQRLLRSLISLHLHYGPILPTENVSLSFASLSLAMKTNAAANSPRWCKQHNSSRPNTRQQLIFQRRWRLFSMGRITFSTYDLYSTGKASITNSVGKFFASIPHYAECNKSIPYFFYFASAFRSLRNSQYIPPELMTTGTYNSNGLADVWVLGISLYRMLVGKFPFIASSDRKLFKKMLHADFSIPHTLSEGIPYLVSLKARRTHLYLLPSQMRKICCDAC